MVAYSTLLPLIFLGVIAGTFALMMTYHVRLWARRYILRQRAATDVSLSPHFELEQVQVPAFMRTQRSVTKQVKIPKMWDIHVPNMTRTISHIRRTSLDDDLDDVSMKRAGTWDMIQPMSVSYVKIAELPLLLQSALSQSDSTRDNTSHRATSTIIAYGKGGPLEKTSSGYDKSAVEAVQVSVLISMPGETAGPLALGIAKVSLNKGGRWRRSHRPCAT